MSLTLRIVSYHAPAMGATAIREFGPEGGVIGRAAGSAWVLPDPQKYISSSHARIDCENGVWFLSDTSTNGTFLNNTQRAIGQGAPVRLNDGDRLYMGEYEILVSLGVGAVTSPPEAPAYSPMTDPFASPATGPGAQGPPADPFGLTPQTVDPLEALDKASGIRTGPSSNWEQQGPPMAEQGPVLEDQMDLSSQKRPVPDDWDKTGYSSQPRSAPPQQVVPPGTPGGVPDDWDKTGYASQPQTPPQAPTGGAALQDWDKTGYSNQPAPPPQQAGPPTQPPTMPPQPAGPPTQPPTMPPSPTQTVEAPQFRPAPAQPGSGDAAALQILLTGAGLDPRRVSPEAANHLMDLSGKIFREVVRGMMDVLAARASLKSEFRITQTTMKPVQNNPLKFSVSTDAALESLLLRSGEGYLQPLEAIHEGFEDIKAHQMAMIAGMHAAFNALLKRLSPDDLVAKFSGSTKGGLLSKLGKGRYWDLYAEMMEEFASDPDAAYRELFGDEFARAYEEQMARLTSLRR